MVTATVREVMTGTAVAVRDDAGHRELVDAVLKHDVGTLVVVDALGRVLGVLAEADLLSTLARDGCRTDPPRADDQTAGDLLSVAGVTIGPDASIATAARLMVATDVERLPVVDIDARLVGTVSRRDLLRAFRRLDRAVCDELAGPVLRRVLALRAPDVHVDVADGVVTLTGSTDRRSTAQVVVDVARTVPGVVEVKDHLSHDCDSRD